MPTKGEARSKFSTIHLIFRAPFQPFLYRNNSSNFAL